MKTPRFVALPSDAVHALQSGAPDANGQVPERHSDLVNEALAILQQERGG